MIFDKKVLKNLNILYAEDDEIQRGSIGKTLTIFFKNVYVALDGVEALETFLQHNIQIVLVDYSMPNIDGYEVAKQIRKINPKIPIIIASAYSDKEKLLNAISVQVIDYLEKPIMLDKLLEVFKNAYVQLQKHNMLFVTFGDGISYDYLQKVCKVGEESIKLTKQEIALVELLLFYKGQLVSKESIEKMIYKVPIDGNTLRNSIYRLRKKIGENNLLTIQDIGYMIPASR